MQQLRERGIAELNPFAVLVGDKPELEVGIVQLTKGAGSGLCHLSLHRQQFLFVLAQCVGLEANESFQEQSIELQRLVAEEPVQSRGGERQQLGTNEAGRLRGARGRVLKAAQHPLMTAIRLVLSRAQKGIDT